LVPFGLSLSKASLFSFEIKKEWASTSSAGTDFAGFATVHPGVMQ
jgi:hypothetical protein